ncbi:MAG: outer membrane lipid asymmetry maintenance protein MlaD [Syntrophobacteraceae bacterium]|jgi:phospholipid/cholesterol/gamma-HCH transport system substrate-binding protein|nr:outer membrane lipid asymmetry maintenance protein MlaD [Syntrophobacteraceae bacterium]
MERKGIELGVGLFLLVGLLCMAYLSFRLGNVEWLGTSRYRIQAQFSNVGGLTENADVSMAGVKIGKVESIGLQDGLALVTLGIDKNVRIEEDAIAGIKTKGIIGDKYISISPGGSDEYIKPNGRIQDTQPPLDIEALLSKFVFGSIEGNKGKQE